MADINIPGISNKYGTNETIKKLMEVEKVPLTREQKKLDTFKDEQNAWRNVNKLMSSLRESVRSLYSFDNPFNTKLATSTEENAVTANPSRDANLESFKIDVKNIATSDRFLSTEMDKDKIIPEGTYTYKINSNTVSFLWKGGKIEDFISALNRRGKGVIKASIIGITKNSKSMLIEAIETGKENKLIFENQALTLALDSGMIKKSKMPQIVLGTNLDELKNIKGYLTSSLRILNDQISIPPLNGFDLPISDKDQQDKNLLTFTIDLINQTEEIEEIIKPAEPNLPDPSKIAYKGIIIYNDNSELGYTPDTFYEPEPVIPVVDKSVAFIIDDNGETPLQPIEENHSEYIINLEDYPGFKGIRVKNNNTNSVAKLSQPVLVSENTISGYEPVNPVSIATDAKLQYEGITMYRSTNEIDDIVPNVKLTLTSPTEKPAIITITPDTETAKDSLISLVGNYNKTIAEINILTQNKPEIITELEYLTDDEITESEKKLGMFMGDTTLSSGKTALQRILSTSYPIEDSSITLLSQLGISTNASSGNSGYSASRMRGYLEIDEKKLDDILKNHISEVKNLFGFDSDGDKIIDTGIGYMMDKNLQAYVQTGGILSMKTNGIDTKIKSSEEKIKKLETQIASKEIEYKKKYGSMESTLNNLNSQADTITNFSNSQNRGN